MLKRILENPFRLFVLVALVALTGIWCSFQLPISLYPQTSKPVVQMGMSYGGYSSQEFIRKYGSNIEFQLEKIKNTGLSLDHVKADYGTTWVTYTVVYDWKVSFDQALKEVEVIAGSIQGVLPKESADSVSVWQRNEGGGFLAISFFSQKHSLNELYNILDPLLGPGLNKIPDSKEAVLWNPETQEVSIQLIPEKLTYYGLLPGEVFRSLESSLPSLTGGEVRIGSKNANVQIASPLKGVEEIENHILKLSDGRIVHLNDVAKIYIGRSELQTRGFKTNGKESLILFADPKSGANVKRMAEDILDLIKSTEASFPEGVEYRILVDPSEFIRNSIQNLFKDVVLAAFFTVLVLFLFIGNFRNVATTAIEIPLSMIIAFIVMYFTDMNLNLISLGGLALAAGMNVDASVVVLENIFRHQESWIKEEKGQLNFSARFNLILNAVREVSAPVFLSIATTLIVFIPLTMTTNLTDAILGDLAKAVIYSHGISGFIAILVVPSIRLLLMRDDLKSGKKGLLEKPLKSFENFYLNVLNKLLNFKMSKALALAIPLILAVSMVIFVLPRLPKEIIGTPDTDWIYLGITAPQSTSTRHMENILQEVESRALILENEKIGYTFVQMHGKTNGSVMLRLKDKSSMSVVVKKMQETFTNTPELYFYVDSWNPAELPLPKMFHLDVKITGKDGDEIRKTASRVKYFLNEQGDYKRISTSPSGLNEKIHKFTPYENVWTSLQFSNPPLRLMDVVDLTFYAGEGKKPGSLIQKGEMIPINIRFSDDRFKDTELLSSYPLKINNKIIPLSALGYFVTEDAPTQIFRRDGREQARITSTLDKGEDKEWEALALKYSSLIANNSKMLTDGKDVSIELLPAQQELIDSLNQIKVSLVISLLLVFLLLWLQFQSFRQVLIIMMTIPLGLIGALPALLIFNSTLSLNSALGILLLNGIAVNNAILFVEVTNQLRKKGLPSREAVLEAGRSRLRPILITSLTTSLGMLPIALGLGDGGKILQPLGLTVTCGLMFSTVTALLVVPLLLFKQEETLASNLSNDPHTILNLMQVSSSETKTEVEPVQ